MKQISHFLCKLFFALAAFVMAGPAAQAARPDFAALKPAPHPPPPPAPRPMPAFNQAAIRQPNLPIAALPAAPRTPSISRPFAVARDGYPPNDGFAAGTGRAATLRPGTIIGRKGPSDGKYVTHSWAPKPASLGLDPKSDRAPMHYYRIRKPLDVVSGKAAPAWGGQGGGKQIKLPAEPKTLAANGYASRTIAPNFSRSAGRRK